MSASRKPLETAPARLAALARLPVFFALGGKRAVVAGGGPAAAWKAELLSAAGARIEVFSDDISAEMQQTAADPPGGEVAVHSRKWSEPDLEGAAIAVGAFDDDTGAAAFAQAARAAGVPVNVIRAAIAGGVAVSVEDIGTALRAGTNCGSCLPELKRIVHDERVTQTA